MLWLSAYCAEPPATSQQTLLDKPAGALPVGTEKDWDLVVDHNAGTGARLEFEQLIAKPVTLPDDGVNEVLDGLAFDSHFPLKTGEGIIPRR